MKKLIINMAPTGLKLTKDETPHVPITPDEICNDVIKCTELGVSMVHLHARDLNSSATYKKECYKGIIEQIREKNKDLILVVSTSGRIFPDFEKRSEVLDLCGDLKPDMASLTLGSLNFNSTASINSPDTIMKLADKMLSKGIKPELEIFDFSMVNFAHNLIKKDLLSKPYYFNIVLGNIGSAQARLLHLGLLVSELPEGSLWSLAGIGYYQKKMNAIGVLEADGVRIGLEDNFWYDDSRTVYATNYSLIDRVVCIANTLGRQVATPREARRMLNLVVGS